MAKVTMAILNQLSQEADGARQRYMSAKDKYDNETIIPKIKAMEGTYLVYRRSCYSCPQKPSDYWDIHAKVTDTEGPCITMTHAYVDSHGAGHLVSKFSGVSFDGQLPSGWARSTKAAFDREVRRVLKVTGIK